MAYERYINKNGKLFIVIRRWHSTVMYRGNVCASPTTVEIIDVEKEQLVVVKHAEFEERLSDGRLRRLTN